MTVLPEQLARLFFLPIGRERVPDKRADSAVEILCSRKLANASATRALIECFHQNTGTLFFIFTPDEAAELFRSVYLDQQGPTKASLGAICAIACVASQYDETTIDQSVRQSYYETAKFYLDDCIEEDEVLGMRVLCLLSIYCAMDKRLTAWTWIRKSRSVCVTLWATNLPSDGSQVGSASRDTPPAMSPFHKSERLGRSEEGLEDLDLPGQVRAVKCYWVIVDHYLQLAFSIARQQPRDYSSSPTSV